MKAVRLVRWSSGLYHPRARPCRLQNLFITSLRLQSTAASFIQHQATSSDTISQPPSLTETQFLDPRTLPSPPPSLAASSAKLNALHARLSLSLRFPLEILARCLVDSSADSNPHLIMPRLQYSAPTCSAFILQKLFSAVTLVYPRKSFLLLCGLTAVPELSPP